MCLAGTPIEPNLVLHVENKKGSRKFLIEGKIVLANYVQLS